MHLFCGVNAVFAYDKVIKLPVMGTGLGGALIETILVADINGDCGLCLDFWLGI
ncbi:hypothetical protein IV64_GL002052 [Lactiplantibacillus xiangfangensis]|uniref:Uncharacterized protein n=1 Tax=Lactiplantibacillus xiangfangensis TaxID=942150 RepID=A0A0R2MFU1_9LACO|nr:hypothetical protein IV64_GL002052 [Lactiplantibacillus xiangfangensis]